MARGASAALAAETPLAAPSLLVTTQDLLVYVHGDRRDVASATGSASGYKLIGTMPDGSVLIAYNDFGMQRVEALTPNLISRTIKEFGRIPVTVLGPTSDGFITYNGATQLLFRYDSHGSLVGRPIAPLGVSYAIGIGDAIVTIGGGRLSVYDERGRLRHQTLIDATMLIAMPGDRFAVTDTRYSEVRVYTKELELKATLRFPNRPLLGVATAPDGALAVVNGRPSCTNPDVEVDVFEDINAQPTGRTRTDVGTAVAVALSKDALYVANAPCRRDADGTIATFTRDGTPHGIIDILGTATGLLPFEAQR